MDRDISSLKPDISPKEPLKSNEWLLWCRLCATNTFANCIDMYNNNMEPIHVGKNPANAITRIIEQYFAVKITHQDSLPKVLCKSCFNLMVSMNDFSERVMDVQKMFYELKYNYSNVSLVVKSRYSKDDEINSQKIITQPALTDVCMYRYANIRRSQKNSHTGGDCDNPFAKKETITNNIMQCKADVTSVELLEEDILVDEDGNFVDNSKKEDDPFGSLEESANHANKWILKRAITSKKTYSKNDPSKDANTVLKRKWKVFRGRNEICKKNIKLISDKLDEFQIDIPCRECNEQCKSFQVYFEHLISVHACDATTTKIWKCPLCHKLLSSVHRLEQHLKTHIPREIKMLPCSECDMQFPTNGRLNAHIKIKHNSKLYMCDECGLSLSTKSNLKFHMLTHTDVAPLECEICKKRFKYARRLKIHMETHDDQKHICNVCGLQLNTRVTLRGHMLVHNDIMKYKCDSCGRAFRHKKTLKFHLISHTGLKPYTCDYCDRAFTNGANCRLHKQKIHPDEWAALKASGCIKTIVQRLPNIETLKTLTRSTGNVNPPHVSPKQKQGAYKQTADEIVGKNVASGNKVSRQTVLCGSQNIVLNGKVIVQSGSIIRGDLANVRTGRYCVISKNAVIRPPYKQFSKGIAFFPMHIGDHVFIGEAAVVSAAVIGSFVYIGPNAIIGRRCVLKDCCIIEDGAILPPETTVPSYMRYTVKGTIEGGQGNPYFVPAAMQDYMIDFTKSFYEHFVRKPQAS